MRMEDKNDVRGNSSVGFEENHQQHLRAVAESYLEALGTTQVGMLPHNHGRLAPISMGDTPQQQAPPVSLSDGSFSSDLFQDAIDQRNASFQDSSTAVGRFLNDVRDTDTELLGTSMLLSRNNSLNVFDQEEADDVRSSNGVDPLSSYRHMLRVGQAKDAARSSGDSFSNSQMLITGSMEDPRLQDTIQWLLRDLHVPVGDLKNVLAISSNSSTAVANTGSNSTRQSSNSRGSNGNMISQYKEDIIRLFGEQ